MYEHHTKPLLPQKRFLKRVLKNLLIACVFIAIALFIGMAGYHFICGFGWIDSLQDASMILAGMGPVDVIQNNAGKLFASAYAIFIGVAFLSITAVILAPVAHRFLHKFHLSDEDEK
jgi:hypothetical protein